jgi:hypothetical protein
VAFDILANPREVLGVGSSERLDQARGHLGLRKGAKLGDLEPRRFFRHREVGDGPVHELLEEALARVGAVNADPLRERR